MNRRFFVAWAVVFVAWFLGSYAVHGAMLGEDYMKLGSMMRTPSDAQGYFPYMILAHVLLAGSFVWIYSKGVQSADWFGQGLRFGIAVVLLTIVPTYLIYYAVQPMPGMLVSKQIAFDGVLVLLLALLVAFLFRDRARAD
ncbi:MAG TPA: hypothetical protein VF422_09415 [Dokdonella sp.]